MKRFGSATWSGSLREGKGAVSTSRIDGRLIASQSASASATSFLPC